MEKSTSGRTGCPVNLRQQCWHCSKVPWDYGLDVVNTGTIAVFIEGTNWKLRNGRILDNQTQNNW